jgi:predicted TIM-barrel fold metal-dependent hydrolase
MLTTAPMVDGDIHPKNRSLEELRPFLSNRWWDYLLTYGNRPRHGNAAGFPYPKATPGAYRRDAWPDGGGQPGSDLDLMRRQLLDPGNIAIGVLNPLSPSGHGDQNADFSAAMSTATNEWQLACWTRREPRLRASVCTAFEDAPAAVREIERCAAIPDFVQILALSRTFEPAGARRYWPIYAAAEAAGLPVGFHVFGYSGLPMSGAGWPSFYIEEVTAHAAGCQALVSSMVLEGVFEKFPRLKVVLIEGGFGWIPSLAWRLDNMFERFRRETPQLRRRPSDYIHDHFWVTTQPMEEAPSRRQVIDAMGWIGFDRILFASDYPHWDFDDPAMALPPTLTPVQREQICFRNAHEFYRLG